MGDWVKQTALHGAYINEHYDQGPAPRSIDPFGSHTELISCTNKNLESESGLNQSARRASHADIRQANGAATLMQPLTMDRCAPSTPIPTVQRAGTWPTHSSSSMLGGSWTGIVLMMEVGRATPSRTAGHQASMRIVGCDFFKAQNRKEKCSIRDSRSARVERRS
ncbi:hypothetical protein VTK26DRAFT_668 [Humicola hyalothermophila]